jgi:branched-chain amino acid transport system permease protein
MNVMKTMRRYDLALLALSVVTYLIFSFLIDERVISSFWRLQIVLMCINVILAASLNLINGITGQFSLGHAGFMAVGAYVSAVMTMWYDLPFGLALLIGGLAAAFIGIIIGIPTLRLDGDYLAIATLGMGEIIRITILNIPAVGGASGLTGIPRLTDFTWVFWAMIITLFFIKNMVNSTFGRSCISVRENAIAATAMGINTTYAKVLAFAVGALFAGMAGGLFSHYFSIAHPSSFTFLNSFNYLTMVVLGGLGSMSGAIVGATLLTFITAALADYPEIRMIIYALCLILLMIFRPQGVFGNQEFSLLLQRLIKRRKGGKGNGQAS